MVGQGAGDDAGKAVSLHAHGRQAGGQAQAGVHVVDGLRDVCGGCQPHGLGHALKPVLLLDGGRAGVEGDHRRQKHGVEGAVVQAWIDPAQAVAQAVHAAQAFLEGHGALHRGAHHVQAGLAVTAITRGALNVGPAACQAIERDAVGRGVECRRHEGLHAVSNGVHAGGCGQLRRQAQGELRVADRGPGHQVPRMKTQFASVVHNQYGTARYLAAGAAGGGHGDDGRHPLADAGRAAFDGGVVGEWPLVRGCDGHALCAVDGAAATQGDQAVAGVSAVDGGGGAHGGLGRVRRGLVKHRHRPARQDIERPLQQTGGLDAGVSHHQRAADADALALLPEQGERAKVELDLGDVVDEGHGVAVYDLKTEL